MGTEPCPYHVAIIGLGARGYKTWFECLQRSLSIIVSAVCDSNTATIDSFALRHPNIPAYTSIEHLLKDQQPDFAILSVPNKHHSRFINQLAAAGIPVLKEKPVAESAADFQHLCASPVKIGVVFQRRWQPRYMHFRKLLPMVGNVISIRASLVGRYDPPQDGWRVMDSVGTFQDLGIHMLDVIVCLFGPPSSLLGSRVDDGHPQSRDSESHVMMRWNSSGLVGHLYVSEVAIDKGESLLVRGTDGSLHLDQDEITHFDAKGTRVFQLVVQSRKDDVIESICQEFGDYVSEASNSFSTSIAQMADIVAVSEAVDASFVSNKLETVRLLPIEGLNSLPPPQINDKEQIDAGTSPNMAQQRFLLNTGDKMPGLGLGTRKPKKPRQTYDAVKEALTVGYRHIDTAFRYNNEDQVGQAVRDSGIPREEVWITTKVDNAWHHRVAESVDLSLAALGLEYIDLLLMHWPSPVSPEDSKRAMPDWDFTRTWEDMQRVTESRRVRNIGVSNFGIRNLKKLLSHPACHIVPAVNQIELHPYCSSNDLVSFCKQQGIHCTAYSPLASGLAQLHEDPVLIDLCKRKSKTPQQILYAPTPGTLVHAPSSSNTASIMWGLQRGTSVIPKSVTPDRIAANFDLAGWSLTVEEQGLLSDLETRCRVYPDDWLPKQAFWNEDN